MDSSAIETVQKWVRFIPERDVESQRDSVSGDACVVGVNVSRTKTGRLSSADLRRDRHLSADMRRLALRRSLTLCKMNLVIASAAALHKKAKLCELCLLPHPLGNVPYSKKRGNLGVEVNRTLCLSALRGYG